VLIKKNKPSFLKDFFCPVGGKIELGETPLEGIKREFKEEAGVTINDWKYLSREENKDITIDYFYSIGDLSNVKQMESESVHTIVFSKVYYLRNILINLLLSLNYSNIVFKSIIKL
jgi:8-oxo-dGTP pyrophosphatase MutT (NUDIX family)